MAKRLLLASFIAERLLELWVSRRNARRLLAEGAREYGRWQLPAMVVANVGLALGMAREGRKLRVPWLGAAISAQALRYWAVTSLGGRWSVRVIVPRRAPPVVRGPYRFVRHPNYLAVMLEALALPLSLGAQRTAAAYCIAMGILVAARVRTEEAALPDYEATFAGTPRFIPGLSR